MGTTHQSRRTRLFVIVDPTAEIQIALVKALLIAKLGDCHIHAFMCIYPKNETSTGPGSGRYSEDELELLEEARLRLETLLDPCRISGVPYTTEVVWNSRWVDMALHSVAKSGCDLLIKSSFKHSKAQRLFSQTSDYTLMRYSACPILFTHQEQSWKSDKIVACLDLESTDPQHTRLNNVVLRDARAFADIVGMDLFIASVYFERISDEHLPLEPRGKAVDAEALGELYAIDPERIILRQGEMPETLQFICEEINPSILVMGTLARTGVGGKLIGNTAEKLLDLVDADILTVI